MKIPQIGVIETLKRLMKNRSNYLNFYEEARRDYGSIFYYTLPPHRRLAILDVDIANVLLKGPFKEVRKSINYDELKPFHGNGLVRSEGESWTRQRKAVAAEFQQKHLQNYSQTMMQEILSVVDLWRESAQGSEPRNIAPDMNRTTFLILSKAILGEQSSESFDRVFALISEGLNLSTERFKSPIKLPFKIPTPANTRFLRAASNWRAMISELIDEVRAHPSEGLLSRVITLYDKQYPSLGEELRDLIATLILAGFGTTANSVTWAWAMIAQNPEAQTQLQSELKEKLKGSLPSWSDLGTLPYARAVLQETLRLYPPVPVIGRTNLNPIEVDGFTIPKESVCDISIFSIHRDSKYWKDPLKFPA